MYIRLGLFWGNLFAGVGKRGEDLDKLCKEMHRTTTTTFDLPTTRLHHIVTTFEAKESEAPGVLAQSLGISGRLEWLLMGEAFSF
jgi:hypothetical protein